MALTATTILEVEVGGSDAANGGGFDPAMSGMATDLAATVANTASPVVTSASYNFIARDVGAKLFIQSGTNWTPGWYTIASVASNAATLTASIGSAILYNGQTMTSTAAGCASTASPTSGKWSIDYSQSTSRGIVYTDMVIDGTTNTKYTSAANPVGPNVVGNLISVTAGTGFTVQRVQVVSVSGTTATCDRSLGTLSSTGGNGGLGGAFATPTAAFAMYVTGVMNMFVRYSATPYTVSTSSISLQQSWSIVGYDTTRHFFNADANLPIFRAGANNTRFIYSGSNWSLVRNIQFDNPTAFTGCNGFQMDGGNSVVDRCKFLNLNIGVYASGGNGAAYNCYAESCSVGFQSSGAIVRIGCVAKNCASGFGNSSTPNNSFFFNCINIAPTQNGGVGFFVGSEAAIVNCVVYNPTGTGFDGFQVVSGESVCMNNIAMGCSRYGFSMNSAPNISATFRNNAGFNNTSGNNSTSDITASNNTGFIALTGNPFVNAAGGDFSLNSTAGAGALLRAAGFPLSYPGLSTTNAHDIGAAQHADPAAGGYTPHPRAVGV